MYIKDIKNVLGIPILIASLCCFAPIILVLVGLSTLSFAVSLAHILDGTYQWLFDLFGIIAFTFSLFLYFRKRGICTIDAVKRHRNEIVNKILLFFIIGVVLYFLFFYVFLNEVGKYLHIWQ